MSKDLFYFSKSDRIATIVLLAVIAVINTAIAYSLYFGGLGHVPAQTAALMSYIDPVVAIILSATILGERLDAFAAIGIVLVLGSAVVGEVDLGKRHSAE